MTAKAVIDKKKNPRSNLSTLLCLAVAGLMIALGDNMKNAIYNGFVFSFTTIIPTLFPFFILSDVWSAVFIIDPQGTLAKGFKKIFGINGCGISALLSGLICGFPVGVKVAAQLYKENKITKSELEKLCGFVNNPSIAFVISGVGAGMMGNLKLGIILYISVLFSAVAVGILFRSKSKDNINSADNMRQTFDIVESIKSAGLSSLNVSSCIVFFSGVLGLLSAIIKSDTALSFIALFLEVSNAVKLANYSSQFEISVKLILTAFALGFSGFSVHLQAFAFLPPEVSKWKYLLIKLTQGLISGGLIFILLIFTR